MKKQTEKAEVIYDGECLVRIHIHKHADIEEEDIFAINKAKYELVGDRKHTVLFVPGTYASISHDARKASASEAVNRNAIAKAILVSTTHQRIISNFFIKFNRPPVLTAVFNDEAEALAWLKKMETATHSVH